MRIHSPFPSNHPREIACPLHSYLMMAMAMAIETWRDVMSCSSSTTTRTCLPAPPVGRSVDDQEQDTDMDWTVAASWILTLI